MSTSANKSAAADETENKIVLSAERSVFDDAVIKASAAYRHFITRQFKTEDEENDGDHLLENKNEDGTDASNKALTAEAVSRVEDALLLPEARDVSGNGDANDDDTQSLTTKVGGAFSTMVVEEDGEEVTVLAIDVDHFDAPIDPPSLALPLTTAASSTSPAAADGASSSAAAATVNKRTPTSILLETYKWFTEHTMQAQKQQKNKREGEDGADGKGGKKKTAHLSEAQMVFRQLCHVGAKLANLQPSSATQNTTASNKAKDDEIAPEDPEEEELFPLERFHLNNAVQSMRCDPYGSREGALVRSERTLGELAAARATRIVKRCIDSVGTSTSQFGDNVVFSNTTSRNRKREALAAEEAKKKLAAELTKRDKEERRRSKAGFDDGNSPAADGSRPANINNSSKRNTVTTADQATVKAIQQQLLEETPIETEDNATVVPISSNSCVDLTEPALVHVWRSAHDGQRFQLSLQTITDALTQHLLSIGTFASVVSAAVRFQGRFVTVTWIPPLASALPIISQLAPNATNNAKSNAAAVAIPPTLSSTVMRLLYRRGGMKEETSSKKTNTKTTTTAGARPRIADAAALQAYAGRDGRYYLLPTVVGAFLPDTVSERDAKREEEKKAAKNKNGGGGEEGDGKDEEPTIHKTKSGLIRQSRPPRPELFLRDDPTPAATESKSPSQSPRPAGPTAKKTSQLPTSAVAGETPPPPLSEDASKDVSPSLSPREEGAATKKDGEVAEQKDATAPPPTTDKKTSTKTAALKSDGKDAANSAPTPPPADSVGAAAAIKRLVAITKDPKFNMQRPASIDAVAEALHQTGINLCNMRAVLTDEEAWDTVFSELIAAVAKHKKDIPIKTLRPKLKERFEASRREVTELLHIHMLGRSIKSLLESSMNAAVCLTQRKQQRSGYSVDANGNVILSSIVTPDAQTTLVAKIMSANVIIDPFLADYGIVTSTTTIVAATTGDKSESAAIAPSKTRLSAENLAATPTQLQEQENVFNTLKEILDAKFSVPIGEIEISQTSQRVRLAAVSLACRKLNLIFDEESKRAMCFDNTPRIISITSANPPLLIKKTDRFEDKMTLIKQRLKKGVAAKDVGEKCLLLQTCLVALGIVSRSMLATAENIKIKAANAPAAVDASNSASTAAAAGQITKPSASASTTQLLTAATTPALARIEKERASIQKMLQKIVDTAISFYTPPSSPSSSPSSPSSSASPSSSPQQLASMVMSISLLMASFGTCVAVQHMEAVTAILVTVVKRLDAMYGSGGGGGGGGGGVGGVSANEEINQEADAFKTFAMQNAASRRSGVGASDPFLQFAANIPPADRSIVAACIAELLKGFTLSVFVSEQRKKLEGGGGGDNATDGNKNEQPSSVSSPLTTVSSSQMKNTVAVNLTKRLIAILSLSLPTTLAAGGGAGAGGAASVFFTPSGMTLVTNAIMPMRPLSAIPLLVQTPRNQNNSIHGGNKTNNNGQINTSYDEEIAEDKSTLPPRPMQSFTRHVNNSFRRANSRPGTATARYLTPPVPAVINAMALETAINASTDLQLSPYYRNYHNNNNNSSEREGGVAAGEGDDDTKEEGLLSEDDLIATHGLIRDAPHISKIQRRAFLNLLLSTSTLLNSNDKDGSSSPHHLPTPPSMLQLILSRFIKEINNSVDHNMQPTCLVREIVEKMKKENIEAILEEGRRRHQQQQITNASLIGKKNNGGGGSFKIAPSPPMNASDDASPVIDADTLARKLGTSAAIRPYRTPLQRSFVLLAATLLPGKEVRRLLSVDHGGDDEIGRGITFSDDHSGGSHKRPQQQKRRRRRVDLTDPEEDEHDPHIYTDDNGCFLFLWRSREEAEKALQDYTNAWYAATHGPADPLPSAANPIARLLSSPTTNTQPTDTTRDNDVTFASFSSADGDGDRSDADMGLDEKSLSLSGGGGKGASSDAGGSSSNGPNGVLLFNNKSFGTLLSDTLQRKSFARLLSSDELKSQSQQQATASGVFSTGGNDNGLEPSATLVFNRAAAGNNKNAGGNTPKPQAGNDEEDVGDFGTLRPMGTFANFDGLMRQFNEERGSITDALIAGGGKRNEINQRNKTQKGKAKTNRREEIDPFGAMTVYTLSVFRTTTATTTTTSTTYGGDSSAANVSASLPQQEKKSEATTNKIIDEVTIALWRPYLVADAFDIEEEYLYDEKKLQAAARRATQPPTATTPNTDVKANVESSSNPSRLLTHPNASAIPLSPKRIRNQNANNHHNGDDDDDDVGDSKRNANGGRSDGLNDDLAFSNNGPNLSAQKSPMSSRSPSPAKEEEQDIDDEEAFITRVYRDSFSAMNIGTASYKESRGIPPYYSSPANNKRQGGAGKATATTAANNGGVIVTKPSTASSSSAAGALFPPNADDYNLRLREERETRNAYVHDSNWATYLLRTSEVVSATALARSELSLPTSRAIEAKKTSAAIKTFIEDLADVIDSEFSPTVVVEKKIARPAVMGPPTDGDEELILMSTVLLQLHKAYGQKLRVEHRWHGHFVFGDVDVSTYNKYYAETAAAEKAFEARITSTAKSNPMVRPLVPFVTEDEVLIHRPPKNPDEYSDADDGGDSPSRQNKMVKGAQHHALHAKDSTSAAMEFNINDGTYLGETNEIILSNPQRFICPLMVAAGESEAANAATATTMTLPGTFYQHSFLLEVVVLERSMANLYAKEMSYRLLLEYEFARYIIEAIEKAEFATLLADRKLSKARALIASQEFNNKASQSVDADEQLLLEAQEKKRLKAKAFAALGGESTSNNNGGDGVGNNQNGVVSDRSSAQIIVNDGVKKAQIVHPPIADFSLPAMQLTAEEQRRSEEKKAEQQKEKAGGSVDVQSGGGETLQIKGDHVGGGEKKQSSISVAADAKISLTMATTNKNTTKAIVATTSAPSSTNVTAINKMNDPKRNEASMISNTAASTTISHVEKQAEAKKGGEDEKKAFAPQSLQQQQQLRSLFPMLAQNTAPAGKKAVKVGPLPSSSSSSSAAAASTAKKNNNNDDSTTGAKTLGVDDVYTPSRCQAQMDAEKAAARKAVRAAAPHLFPQTAYDDDLNIEIVGAMMVNTSRTAKAPANEKDDDNDVCEPENNLVVGAEDDAVLDISAIQHPSADNAIPEKEKTAETTTQPITLGTALKGTVLKDSSALISAQVRNTAGIVLPPVVLHTRQAAKAPEAHFSYPDAGANNLSNNNDVSLAPNNTNQTLNATKESFASIYQPLSNVAVSNSPSYLNYEAADQSRKNNNANNRVQFPPVADGIGVSEVDMVAGGKAAAKIVKGMEKEAASDDGGDADAPLQSTTAVNEEGEINKEDRQEPTPATTPTTAAVGLTENNVTRGDSVLTTEEKDGNAQEDSKQEEEDGGAEKEEVVPAVVTDAVSVKSNDAETTNNETHNNDNKKEEDSATAKEKEKEEEEVDKRFKNVTIHPEVLPPSYAPFPLNKLAALREIELEQERLNTEGTEERRHVEAKYPNFYTSLDEKMNQLKEEEEEKKRAERNSLFGEQENDDDDDADGGNQPLKPDRLPAPILSSSSTTAKPPRWDKKVNNDADGDVTSPSRPATSTINSAFNLDGDVEDSCVRSPTPLSPLRPASRLGLREGKASTAVPTGIAPAPAFSPGRIRPGDFNSFAQNGFDPTSGERLHNTTSSVGNSSKTIVPIVDNQSLVAASFEQLRAATPNNNRNRQDDGNARGGNDDQCGSVLLPPKPIVGTIPQQYVRPRTEAEQKVYDEEMAALRIESLHKMAREWLEFGPTEAILSQLGPKRTQPVFVPTRIEDFEEENGNEKVAANTRKVVNSDDDYDDYESDGEGGVRKKIARSQDKAAGESDTEEKGEALTRKAIEEEEAAAIEIFFVKFATQTEELSQRLKESERIQSEIKSRKIWIAMEHTEYDERTLRKEIVSEEAREFSANTEAAYDQLIIDVENLKPLQKKQQEHTAEAKQMSTALLTQVPRISEQLLNEYQIWYCLHIDLSISYLLNVRQEEKDARRQITISAANHRRRMENAQKMREELELVAEMKGIADRDQKRYAREIADDTMASQSVGSSLAEARNRRLEEEKRIRDRQQAAERLVYEKREETARGQMGSFESLCFKLDILEPLSLLQKEEAGRMRIEAGEYDVDFCQQWYGGFIVPLNALLFAEEGIRNRIIVDEYEVEFNQIISSPSARIVALYNIESAAAFEKFGGNHWQNVNNTDYIRQRRQREREAEEAEERAAAATAGNASPASSPSSAKAITTPMRPRDRDAYLAASNAADAHTTHIQKSDPLFDGMRNTKKDYDAHNTISMHPAKYALGQKQSQLHQQQNSTATTTAAALALRTTAAAPPSPEDAEILLPASNHSKTAIADEEMQAREAVEKAFNKQYQSMVLAQLQAERRAILPSGQREAQRKRFLEKLGHGLE